MARKPNRLLTDALREIKKTMSRFLSLFLLSALAVAFLAGLRTTAPNMERTADRYFDNLNLMDLRVISTLGLTHEDISVLAAQPGIEGAEGAYTVDALVHLEENDLITKLHSLSPAGINAPELLEGRLPENDRECLAEPKLLEAAGLSIGDAISFDTGDGTFEDALKYEVYTVVGTVRSPLYVSVERGSSSLGAGRVFAFAILPHTAFDMEFYTDAYLLSHGTRDLICYSDAYDERMDALADRLEPLSDVRAALRYDDVIDEANGKLNEARQELDDAETEVNQELSDAKIELTDARTKLDDGWAEYRDGKATLSRETADATQKIADAKLELADAKLELDDAKVALDDGEVEYLDGLTEWQDGKVKYEDGLTQWQEGKAEYDENRQKLIDGQKEYDDGLKKYSDGLVELQNGAGMLAAAKKQLDRAKAQIDSGSSALSDGQRQYEEGAKALAQARESFGTLLQSIVGGTLMAGDPITEEALLTPNGSLSGPQNAVAIQVLRGASSALEAQLAQLAAIGKGPGDPAYDAINLQKEGMSTALVAAQSGSPFALYAIPGFLQGMNTELTDQQNQLAAAKAQLDSGSAALSSGYDQYRKGLKEYKESLALFDQSVLDIQAAKVELDDAKLELDDGWEQLAEGKLELDDGWRTLEESALQLSAGESSLIEGRRELDDGWLEYQDGLVKYEDGLVDLAQAEAELPAEIAKAKRELSDALVELEDGEGEYADGLVEYTDGKAEADQELSDARKKLNDARRDIADIESGQWYILDRRTNIGYVSYGQDAERMGNLASVFPLIFFLVAALVCLTTMTRMVEEQRVQIGGLKALGYGKGAIALKYVGYGFLASFLGGVIGLIVGCIAIPTIIFTAWGALYTMGDLIILFYPDLSLLAVGAAVLCVTGTALATAFTTLHAVPAQLMRPRAPKAGKRVLLERIGPLWNRLSFTWKVTLRNLFRYKKRFWMTVVGIGGCAALIVTGFGIRDSILDTLNNQYDYISTYSSEISLADDLTDDEYTEIARLMDKTENVEAWMPCYTETLSAEGAKRTMDATLFAVEDMETFGDFIRLRHRLDDEKVALPPDGAVITEKLSEMLGVKVGDSLTLDGDKRVTVTIADITENYILHYVYLSAEYYESLFGAPPAANVLLSRYADESKEAADALSTRLIALSGVNSVSIIRDTRDTFSKSLESVDYAVVVVIVAAAALAFVVLFNLTNINITERMRELATLKVLGFYDGELSSYVYRENVFLTLFGVGLGLVMGKFLHQWLVLTVEIDMVMFGRTARPMSYLYAVGLTLLFSLLVNLVARRKLQRIDMVESLKTVE